MLRKRKEYFVLAIAFTFIMAVSLMLFLFAQAQSHGRGIGSEDRNAARDVIYSASGLTGLDANVSERVIKLAEGGIMSVADHVISVMDSPEYLLMDKDDDAFAQDLIALSKSKTGPAEIKDLLSSHTAPFVINKVLSDTYRVFASDSVMRRDAGSSVEGISLDTGMGGDSDYTVGIKETSGHMNVTGNEIRTDFFVDGKIYRGYLTGDNKDGKFTLAWDTTGVSEGLHTVYALIRSSDGRGAVALAGDINVPSMQPIENGRVTRGLLVGGADSSWYIYDCHNDDCYVNIVGADGDIEASLYDVYGHLIGIVDNPGTCSEALRSHPQDIKDIEKETGIEGISNCFYIKISKSSKSSLSDSDDISYKLVQSQDVAYFNGTYMAVVDNEDKEKIRLCDYNGIFYEAKESEIDYVPVTGHLSDLVFEGGTDRSNINIWPDFAPDKYVYAKYLDKGGSLKVRASAIEGFGAKVDITARDPLGKDIKMEDEAFDLALGENNVHIEVTGFDGRKKDYDIYILNGLPDDPFAQNTMSKFPQSYYSGIWMLHKLRPDYVFTPYTVVPTFGEVLANEDSGYQSLLQESSHPNYIKQNSIVYDAPDWKAAKGEVVSYFLDPRNFLLEDRIFMFENLSFNEKIHTKKGVEDIIRGSFMDTSEFDYANAILEAGRKSGVSPYFIASRILQEMGYSGESSLAHGKVPGFDGIYNYYNIGSIASSEPGVAVANGAKFASGDDEQYLLPWNTIDKAITGGAMWIAKGYISRGQNTLYFQKFDIQGEDGKYYTHQYAQNLMMAYSESMRYYRSYKSTSSLDSPFEFIIPVYNGLPDAYGTLPQG